MKKLLALVLVAALTITCFCMSVSAYTGHVNEGDTLVFNGATSDNAFGDLLNWNVFVSGDVNNQTTVEGTLAAGGSFNSTGFSANAGVGGVNPVLTDDVALLVNDNLVITATFGNIWGQTVVGTADGNTYHLTNQTLEDPNGELPPHYTVANTSQYFADATSTAAAAKAAIDALPENGTVSESHSTYDNTYVFEGDPNASVLVYNVDDSLFSRYTFDFTIANGQTIVVNLTSPDTIVFDRGRFVINGETAATDIDYLKGYNRNIIINVANASEIDLKSGEMYGILLAPNTNVSGTQFDIYGTSILGSLDGSAGLHFGIGGNSEFVPGITVPVTDPTTPAETPTETPSETPAETVGIRIDAPLKMAVAFEDGTVYYGGEMKDVEVGKEYLFQMCAVNWENGIYDGNENGLAGTVVYRMKVVHQNEFNELARTAKEDPERYIVKGIDIIDNETKTIIVNCDAKDTHLETDVNSFFVAYRFHFEGQDYNKKTGIDKVINNPLESLSVNLPAGTTVACNAYIGGEASGSDNVFITVNNGEGIYDDELLTSVNDYTWVL